MRPLLSRARLLSLLGNPTRGAREYAILNAQSRNDYDGAEYYYERALSLNIELRRDQRQADDLTNLGDVWDKRRDRAKACDYWRRSMPLYERSGAKDAGNAKISTKPPTAATPASSDPIAATAAQDTFENTLRDSTRS
jgi:tetratricopeptide (TPR) repeat protein